jgi:hypothetical protein
MGRLYLSVLVLAACGDNEQGPTFVGPTPQATGATGSVEPVPRAVPEVCGALQWDAGALGGGSMQVSVVASPTDVHVVGVPVGGGALQGFSLATNAKQTGTNGQGPVVSNYTEVGIARVADHLVTVGTDGAAIHVTLLDANLANPIDVGSVDGTQVVPQAVLLADGTRLVPVGTDTSIGIQAFDSTWQIGNRRELAPTSQTKGFAASQLGAAMLVGWSTPDTCYLATVFTTVGVQVSQVSYPCPELRIAGNSADGTASLVFWDNDGVHLVDVTARHTLLDSRLVRAHATAPRTLFDGTRTWISYLDERGDVVAGFLGPDGELISAALSDTRPDAAAYDLAWFDGAPWVFAIDGTTLSATRMCVTEQ